jgi:hypothetical protein
VCKNLVWFNKCKVIFATREREREKKLFAMQTQERMREWTRHRLGYGAWRAWQSWRWSPLLHMLISGGEIPYSQLAEFSITTKWRWQTILFLEKTKSISARIHHCSRTIHGFQN